MTAIEVNQYPPVAVIQEGQSGITDPALQLNANWKRQYIGLTWPDVLSGRPPATAVVLRLKLIPGQSTDYAISQDVSVCPAPGSNGIPSTWETVSVVKFAAAAVGGDVIEIPLTPETIMGQASWAIVLHANEPRAYNLKAVTGSVLLEVTYDESGEPDPVGKGYVYSLFRDFVPGDSVTVRVVDGGQEAAVLRWDKQTTVS